MADPAKPAPADAPPVVPAKVNPWPEFHDELRKAEAHDPTANPHRLWELHYLVAGKPIPKV